MECEKQTAGEERLASAWLGEIPEQSGAPCSQPSQLDMIANGALAKFTGNLSPAALSNAYFDWLNICVASPRTRAI
jgi:polyhydroxyalkanoate synthase